MLISSSNKSDGSVSQYSQVIPPTSDYEINNSNEWNSDIDSWNQLKIEEQKIIKLYNVCVLICLVTYLTYC